MVESKNSNTKTRKHKTMKTYLKLKIALCAFAALTCITLNTAHCQDTVVIGSNHQTGGEGAGDRQAMQNIQDGMRNLRNMPQRP